ncbi:hypothetical protein G9C98_002131 [Cotesia typhae]|uniref:Uncharacterized protein n=1 Tax=Cotesia typhae TaxID=2053667 RepID=A0A8J5QU57_9HYME|nr:hypothetical protein G9C98_002131 [Cotesia typhae]
MEKLSRKKTHSHLKQRHINFTNYLIYRLKTSLLITTHVVTGKLNCLDKGGCIYQLINYVFTHIYLLRKQN